MLNILSCLLALHADFLFFFSVGLLEEEAHRIDNKDNFMINTLENENKGLDSDSQVFCMEGSL